MTPADQTDPELNPADLTPTDQAHTNLTSAKLTSAKLTPSQRTATEPNPTNLTATNLTTTEFALAMEATWPPLARHQTGPWTIREGAGGGKRVSAASAHSVWTDTDIPQAEAAMQSLGQDLLFVIWPGDEALDAALAARGYALIDPVLAYAAPLAAFQPPPRMSTFPHWPAMQIARDIWAEGDIGPDRLAVMERVQGPKTVLLARSKDKPSGAAFVALHGKTALIHAIEVRPAQRRLGAARHILAAAALWASQNGADRLALAVTEANGPARALYTSLGLQVVGNYHYRTR
jgi:GNAT superfamily N-acetyltransferase